MSQTGRSTRHAHLSFDEARRIALAAQGFTGGAPKLPGRRPFDGALAHLRVLQLDSVNVFSRSHYMPVFSRHGAYDTERLDAQLWRSGEFTEYWAHEAALVPVADRALFAWRMDDARERHRDRAEKLRHEIERVRAQLADGGPQFVRELEEGPRGPRGPWWDWSDTKHAVELLFAEGAVVAAGREKFQRRYALAEQVLDDALLAPVERSEAQRQLIARSAAALGVGTLADLADYYRLSRADVKAAVSTLVEQGELVPVEVEGWRTPAGRAEPAWMHRDARVPSRLAPDALLTPFDPLVWFRPRAERMFHFHYRIEIYTPQAKRQYGYYSLPIMVGGRMVGRTDLKADRKAGVLLVQSAWQEPGAPARTAEVAKQLIARAAAWQGLSEVRSAGAGTLALPQLFAAG